MKFGLGLPIGDPASLLSWARRADAGPFSTLGLLDRLVYNNPEPLVTLAAVAGSTARIRVQSNVLLAPLRDPVLLAKQCATLDRVSGGRFTLGIGVGTRKDDYQAAGVDFGRRGRRLDEQMALMRRIWAGQRHSEDIGPIGPWPTEDKGPEVLFGAFKPVSIERVARWGDGLLSAAPLEYTEHLFRGVQRSWRAAGRAGDPRLVAQVNVALGPDTIVNEARDALRCYYGLGDYTHQAVERMLTTAQQVRTTIAGFRALGADEVMLYCWSCDAEQITRIADAVA